MDFVLPEKLLQNPDGSDSGVLAILIFYQMQRGDRYYFPKSRKLVQVSSPAELISKIKEWNTSRPQIPHYNQVKAHYDPLIQSASKVAKQHLINDLLSYAQELQSQI